MGNKAAFPSLELVMKVEGAKCCGLWTLVEDPLTGDLGQPVWAVKRQRERERKTRSTTLLYTYVKIFRPPALT